MLQIDLGEMAEKFVSDFVDFVPGIIGALLIILVGYFVSRLIKRVIISILGRIGFERLCDRIKLTQTFQKVGFKSVSSLIGTLAFWALFIVFIGWGFGFVNVPQLIPILAAISLLISRALAAVVIVIIGIAVALLVVETLKKILSRFELDRYFEPFDRTIVKTGVKIIDFFYYAVEAFIVLFFVEGAFQVLNVEFLSRIMEPILLYIPRFIVATVIILLGLVVAEFCVRIVKKILAVINFDQFVKPVEVTLNRGGIINSIIFIIIRIFVMVFFLQMAFDILGIPILTQFLNTILLWLPALVVAMAVVVIAWWLGSWLGEKVEGWTRENDIPFASAISMGVKYVIVIMGVLIAMDQIGIEVMILNTILLMVAIALIIPIAVALSFGFKDYGSDLGVGIKLKRIAKKGDRIEAADIEGELVEVGNLASTIKTRGGEIVISNAALAKARVVKKGK